MKTFKILACFIAIVIPFIYSWLVLTSFWFFKAWPAWIYIGVFIIVSVIAVYCYCLLEEDYVGEKIMAKISKFYSLALLTNFITYLGLFLEGKIVTENRLAGVFLGLFYFLLAVISLMTLLPIDTKSTEYDELGSMITARSKCTTMKC